MAATYANSLLKEDADAFLLESSHELALHVTFVKSLDATVGLKTDVVLAPGDDSDVGEIVIDDSSDDYGADGDPFILVGTTPTMAKVAAASGFINQAVLPRFSRGLTGGPGFKTIIQEVADGSEVRISKWQRPKRRFDIGAAIDTPQDFRELLAHYRQVRGALNGFRMRDPFDWSTHPNHMTAPDINEPSHRQLLGAGDGTTKLFQLVKRYSVGNLTRVRPITHPQFKGSPNDAAPAPEPEAEGFINEVYVDGSRQTSDINWIYNGGQIEFDAAPAAGAAIEWCGTYEVPVRFDQEIDQALMASMDTTDSYSVQLTATELSVPEHFSDHKWMGGACVKFFSENTAIYLGGGRLWAMNATTTGLKVYAPATKHMLTGEPFVTIKNLGSNSFDIYATYPSASKLTTLTTQQHAHLLLCEDGTIKAIQ